MRAASPALRQNCTYKQGRLPFSYINTGWCSTTTPWAIRREWAMTHWRESANLMWRNLEHVTGAYSEHAKKKRYEHRREAWGDAHRAAGTHRENGTSRRRGHRALRRDASGDARA